MNVESLRVRPGTTSDAMALRDIRLEALADSPEAFGDTYERCVAWDDEQWTRCAEEWNFYLAERGGRVVGMARGEVHDERPNTRWLFAMYVSPQARGTTVARELVDAVGAWALAEGVDALHLYVSSSMSRAKAFYAKCGFAPTGHSVSGGPEDPREFLEMRRPLGDGALRVVAVDPRALHDLRRRVLRDDDATIDVENRGDELPTTVHLGGYLLERLVVGASFFEVPAPFDPTGAAYQLRYMATDFDVRGRGLGSRLLAHAFAVLAPRGVTLLWANARTSAVDFYVATGWRVLEDSLHVSAETGIDHVVIFRSIE